jgi:hypothetical protein
MSNLFICTITMTCDENSEPVPLTLDANSSSVRGIYIVLPVQQMIPSLTGNKYLFQLSGEGMTNKITEGSIVYTTDHEAVFPVVFTIAWKIPADYSKASGSLSVNRKSAYRIKSMLHKSQKKKYCRLEISITQLMQ